MTFSSGDYIFLLAQPRDWKKMLWPWRYYNHIIIYIYMWFNTVNVHELQQCTSHNKKVSKGWRLNINLPVQYIFQPDLPGFWALLLWQIIEHVDCSKLPWPNNLNTTQRIQEAQVTQRLKIINILIKITDIRDLHCFKYRTFMMCIA